MNDTAILNELIKKVMRYVSIDPCNEYTAEDLYSTVLGLINDAIRERRRQHEAEYPCHEATDATEYVIAKSDFTCECGKRRTIEARIDEADLIRVLKHAGQIAVT